MSKNILYGRDLLIMMSQKSMKTPAKTLLRTLSILAFAISFLPVAAQTLTNGVWQTFGGANIPSIVVPAGQGQLQVDIRNVLGEICDCSFSPICYSLNGNQLELLAQIGTPPTQNSYSYLGYFFGGGGGGTQLAISLAAPPAGTYYFQTAYRPGGPCISIFDVTNWDLRVTYGPPIPAAPTPTAATGISSNAFTANWNASSGATGYFLDISSDKTFGSFLSGYQNLDVGNSTNHGVTGLSVNTTYYYRLRAYNVFGTSEYSSTVMATTLANGSTNGPPPGANLVLDGGFENGTNFSPGWSVSGLTNGYPRIDEYPPYAHSGSYYADIGGSGNNSISQTLATVPGTTYDVSMWLANLDLDSGWNVTFGCSNIFSGNVPVQPYTFYETQVQAYGPLTPLTISYVQTGLNPSPLHVDDISVVALPNTNPPPPPNLVADGGFEYGTDLTQYWTVAGASGGYPRIDDYQPYAHTGCNYVDIGGSGNNSISQVLNTTPGATYNVSLWMANLNDPSSWQVAFGNNILFRGNVPLQPYTLYETNVQATSCSTVLSIAYLGGTPSPLHVDDISVTEISEPTNSPTTLSNGLAAYYQFEGNGLDSSTNHLDLTLFGNPDFAPGLFGQALDLHHNLNQYAQRLVDDAAFDFGVNDFTIQVWLNLYSFGSYEQTFIEKFEGATGPGWTLTSPSFLQFYASGALIMDGNANVTTNVWHQLVVRKCGNDFEMLLDDSMISSESSANAISATKNGLLIGKRNADDGRDFSVDGRLDEIAIWNRALSDSEIASLYNGGKGVLLSNPQPVILTNILIPNNLGGIAVNPALNKIYLAGGDPGAETMIEVDGDTFAQTALGSGGSVDVDVTNNNYWSVGIYSGAVTVWNSNNAVITNISLGYCPTGVNIDAPHRRVWVSAQCGSLNDPVWAIDADNYQVLGGPIGSGGVQGHTEVNSATGRFYIAPYIAPNVVSKRVYPSTFAVTFNSFGTVLGVNAALNLLYAVTNNNVLQIINGSPDPEKVLANVTLPFSFGNHIAVNTILNRVYVGSSGSNLVAVLDEGTGQLLKTIQLASSIVNVGSTAIDIGRNRVYVEAFTTNTSYLYVIEDAANNASPWVTKAPVPAGRYGATAVPLNNQLYLMGGDVGSDASNTAVQVYNPATDSWTNAAPLLGGRKDSEAGVMSNRIYYVGGWTYSPPLPNNNLWIYDPTGNSWTSGTTFPMLNADGASGIISNRFYVTTPDDGYSGYYNFLNVYDPAGGGWGVLPSSPIAHSDPGFGVINNRLYVVGGQDNSGAVVSQLDVYDPAANAWSTNAPMPTPRTGTASAVVAGKLYVMGGWNGSNYLDTVEIYDPVGNSWTSGPPLPTARIWAAGCAIGGVIYVAGGMNSTNRYLSTVEALQVVPPASISSVQTTSSTINFAWNVVAGQSYQVQYLTNLVQGSWVNFGDIITATNSTITVSDSLTNSERFYRILFNP